MSDRVKPRLRYTTGALALAAVLGLAGNTWWLYTNLVNVVNSTDWVEKQAAIQYDLSRVEVALLNAETGHRGYILTGMTDYLGPYHTGQASTSVLLARLAAAHEDDPTFSGLMDDLAGRVQAKFTEMAGSLSLMVREGQPQARARVASGAGRVIMDDIRGIIAEMEAMTDAELATRQQEQLNARIAAFAALSVFVAGTLALIGTLLIISQRELQRRTRNATEIEGYAVSLNQSLYELKQERNEIRSLHEVAGFLQSCDTLDELVAVLKTSLASMFKEFDGQLLVHAPSRNRLDCVVSFGKISMDHPIAPSDCWGLRRGQDHIHRATDTAPACLHFEQNGIGGQAANTFCIPLLAHGETIGLLSMAMDIERLPQDIDANEALDAAWRRAERLGTQLGLTLANLRLRESLRQQAIRDALTNSFNRRYLDGIGDKILAQANRFGQDVAVVMLDVDHFKAFNDMHGHQSGDHALIAVAHFIQSQIREADWLFRYGGEEFLIILQGLNRENSQAKLEEIREGVSKLQFTNGETVLPSVTISLGCAFYDHQSPECLPDLIAEADEALYAAKSAGRNRLQLAMPPQVAAVA